MKGSKQLTSNFSFLAKNMKAAFPKGLQRLEASQCQQLKTFPPTSNFTEWYAQAQAYKPSEERSCMENHRVAVQTLKDTLQLVPLPLILALKEREKVVTYYHRQTCSLKLSSLKNCVYSFVKGNF